MSLPRWKEYGLGTCDRVGTGPHPHPKNGLCINWKPLDGWIPVSERLPEEEGEYLVWCDGSQPCCNGRGVVAPFHFWPQFKGFREDITHWMPLPEPPK